MPNAELLTPAEHDAIAQAGELWNTLQAVVADGPARQGDLNEVLFHIHGIQRAVLKNAAARAYPDLYRLLGGWPAGEPQRPRRPRKPHLRDFVDVGLDEADARAGMAGLADGRYLSYEDAVLSLSIFHETPKRKPINEALMRERAYEIAGLEEASA